MESQRQDLLAYLRTTRDLLTETIREKLPSAKVPDIEATYPASTAHPRSAVQTSAKKNDNLTWFRMNNLRLSSP